MSSFPVTRNLLITMKRLRYEVDGIKFNVVIPIFIIKNWNKYQPLFSFSNDKWQTVQPKVKIVFVII